MRRARAIAVLFFAVSVFGTSAHAATTSGSNLANVPDATPCDKGSCSVAQLSLPPESQAAGGIRAGSSGVVVRWRLRRAPGSARRVALRVVRPDGQSQGDVDVPLPASGGVHVLHSPTRLRVESGDVLGVDVLDGTGEAPSILNQAPEAGSYAFWSPMLGYSDSRRADMSGEAEILLNVDIEPDRDGDGAGDETQDDCPDDPRPVSCFPEPPPPREPPTLLDPSISDPVFRVLPGGPLVARRRVGRGTVFRFGLDESASVTATIQRRVHGRRAEGSCRRKTRRNRGRPACVRFGRVGALTTSGRVGRNRVPFSGRLRIRGRARSLTPGRYRARLRAVDADGERSSPIRPLAFRVVR